MFCEPGQFSARISESLQSWYRAKRRSSTKQETLHFYFLYFFLLLEAATQYRITMLASLPDNAAGLWKQDDGKASQDCVQKKILGSRNSSDESTRPAREAAKVVTFVFCFAGPEFSEKQQHSSGFLGVAGSFATARKNQSSLLIGRWSPRGTDQNKRLPVTVPPSSSRSRAKGTLNSLNRKIGEKKSERRWEQALSTRRELNAGVYSCLRVTGASAEVTASDKVGGWRGPLDASLPPADTFSCCNRHGRLCAVPDKGGSPIDCDKSSLNQEWICQDEADGKPIR